MKAGYSHGWILACCPAFSTSKYLWWGWGCVQLHLHSVSATPPSWLPHQSGTGSRGMHRQNTQDWEQWSASWGNWGSRSLSEPPTEQKTKEKEEKHVSPCKLWQGLHVRRDISERYDKPKRRIKRIIIIWPFSPQLYLHQSHLWSCTADLGLIQMRINVQQL